MGLFDRLFGQEENQSQETVANQEISETEALDNQDLQNFDQKSSSLIIKIYQQASQLVSQTEQVSQSENQKELYPQNLLMEADAVT
ncbi:MAG: hypothetical protein ACLUOJ_05010 [Streptococcus salivarius]